ncbi:MAG: GTP pyrophosphokinase [Planctomycetota bacterium]|jgi:ppGpp synthetase/RelA/SpoT-type nucleotidyltranferase
MKQAEFDSFFERYKKRLPEFKLLMDEGERTLKKATSMIKVHSITSRIKGFDSCLSKVIDKKIEEPFEGIRDFVGLRAVCLFLSDLDRVEKVIDDTFEVIEREDKTNNSEKDVFGYMGKHFIVKLKAKDKTDAMPFEIQVRTIAQDAWASVSHHLDYKTNSIPEELKRDFYALSGLFYVADTHFSFIKHDKMSGN